MPLKYFICPDGQKIETKSCLSEGGCRMGNRCSTRSYLQLVSKDRPWTGKPSTTQLISGTMQAFLKITNDYAISPDSRAFMVHGTKAHSNLEGADDEYSLLEERFEGDETPETGISDVFEVENGKSILADYKTSGSYKIAKALGFYVDDEETGEVFKSGPRKGLPKTRKVLKRDDSKMDRLDWELQLNKYRIELEKRGLPVDEMRIQCIARDGNTYIARSRGVFRNVYYFRINKIADEYVLDYFKKKREALLKALKMGECSEVCNAQENWEGLKCAHYCEVAEFCPLGKYLKKEKEVEDMAIKNLSDVRRLPRLGKIRLGIKKSKNGVEYPAEVDYFILAPQTSSELENQKLIDEFHKLYGEKPKSIKIMLPVGNLDTAFPQFYKRYGKTTLLQCKGDGVEATCSSEEFAEGLEVLRKNDLGLPVVKCLGKECSYHKSRKCSVSATLQLLLPDLPGAGVWQLTTGSFNSIVNINSCLEYVRAVAGRFHMIPLTLERREQEIQYEGRKGKHHTLHINMDIRLTELQKYGQIDSTKILLELPDLAEEKEDIIFERTPEEPVDAEITEEKTAALVDIKRIKQLLEIAEAGGIDGSTIHEVCMEAFGGKEPKDLTEAEFDQLKTLIDKEIQNRQPAKTQAGTVVYVCQAPGCKRTIIKGATFCPQHEKK